MRIRRGSEGSGAAAKYFGFGMKLDMNFKPTTVSYLLLRQSNTSSVTLHFLQLRALFMMICMLFKSMRCTQNGSFIKGFADNLQSDRKSILRIRKEH